MSLALSQVAVSGTAGLLVTVNPYSSVTLVASAATYVGTASTVTTSTGFLLPANVPVTLSVPGFVGAAAVSLYAITASSSNVSVALTGEP